MVIKKIKGNKRHIAVDSSGILLAVIVGRGNQHDSQQLIPLLNKISKQKPFLLETVLADKAYKGFEAQLLQQFSITLDIKVNLKASGFQVMDGRWKVERSFAWMKGYRRLNKDYEKSAKVSEAFVTLYGIMILLKKYLNYQII